MAGSTFGTNFRITTWGESHGKAIGVVVDGCPAGLCLDEDDIQIYLDRRKPGTSSVTTPRKEDDKVEILSGVFEGKTTGTPISLLIPNTSQHSKDYSDLADKYRPGHADYSFDAKFGFRDYRGGGRSSGRETAARVAAGAIAIKILAQLGITVNAYTKSIGDVVISQESFDLDICKENPVYMPDSAAAQKAIELIDTYRGKQDSVGGVVEVVADGVPAGIGEPVFDKLDARLSQALFSVGAVKAVEIGDGTAVSVKTGSENNDGFHMEKGQILPKTNHAGGILGGISSGAPVIARAHFKPTPSIFQPQHTVTSKGEDTIMEIKGRHDPCIVPRAVVVVECMTAITILDEMLSNLGSKMEHLKKIYE